MLNPIVSYVLLSTVAGFVFSHTLPPPHEKRPEWEQPVVISEEFFPPHPPPHHPPHLPHNEFKEIIGIELQRIPFHGGPEHDVLEHEMHKEHEILEHRRHEVLGHGSQEHEFPKHHIPLEGLNHEHREHEIHSHELPRPGLLEHEHGEFGHHHHPTHGFHNVMEHERRELEHEHREHERRELEHELRDQEHAHEHEILEHEHHEHDIHAHELPHHPPWEDPDFVLSEEEHHHEHEHEFHHEELFPEVSRRRTNRRREGGSSGGNSRRNNSNSGRRENSNRRENNNRQGNNNRRENSNRRREGGTNTEELFPRGNRQNNRRNNNSNNSNNNNNNRRNNNNREGSRRNSNIEELEAIEEEIMHAEEVPSQEIMRPERDVSSFYSSDRRETSVYESPLSMPSETIYQTQGLGLNIQSSSRPSQNNFDVRRNPDQQGFTPSQSVLGNHERQFETKNSHTSTGQQLPDLSHPSKQEYSDSSSGFQDSSSSRQKRPSSNIFLKEEDYLTLDGSSSSQRPSSTPSEPSYNNHEQDWSQQGGLSGNSRPNQSQFIGSNRPDEFSNGDNTRPSFLGSQPGSGKPLGPGNLSGQESSRPNRPEFGSSGFYTNEEERPQRPNGGFSGLHSNQEGRPNRPSTSGLYSNEEGRPNRPSSGSSGAHFNQEGRPNRPSSGSSGLYSSEEGRPNRPSSGSSGVHFNQEERPGRPNTGSSGLYSNEEGRPNRPSSGSSGAHFNQEERPGRPNTGSSGHYSHQGERPSHSSGGNSRPNRPSNSHFSSQEHGSHEHSSRPHIHGSSTNDGNSRPRPPNGNNSNVHTDLISTQEDSWHWPGQSEEEDKQNRRALHSSGGNKNPSTMKGHTTQGNKNQHANLKLLPTDTCGVDLANRIIGGENTQLDEFPWMALLQHSSGEGRALGFGCGGSLISPRYVLTAAHCIKGPAIGNNVRVTKVRLGEFDTSSDVDCQGDLCSAPPVDVPVEEIIVHPKYRATDRAQLNDIALIRLSKNVKNSAYVSPICLPISGKKDHSGENLTVAGWGKTSNGQNGASSKTKQKVSVPVIALKDCSPFYNRINIQLNNTQMCAGGEKGKDSCQGDSGGPLMGSEIIDSQVRWQVHGIVSFGPEDCGIDKVAGVYTKVSEYIDWILDNMKA